MKILFFFSNELGPPINWCHALFHILITSAERMNFMSQSSQHIGHSGGPLLEAQNGLVRPTATGDKCNVSEPTLNWHHVAQKASGGSREGPTGASAPVKLSLDPPCAPPPHQADTRIKRCGVPLM